MASTLCVSASALTVSSNDVIRVYCLQNDGTNAILNGYKNFENCWNAVVDYDEVHL